MRQVFAILFLLSMCCQHSYKLWVLADYYLNKNFISRSICVNRDRPQMKCQGKCYLKKKLEQNENQDQRQATGNAKKTIPDTPLFYYAPRLDLGLIFNLSVGKFSPHNELKTFSCLHSVFRPPSMKQSFNGPSLI